MTAEAPPGEPTGRKERPEYRFEIKYGAQYVDPDDIHWEAAVLLRRLEAPQGVETSPTLRRFVRDTVFAIEWYEDRIKRLRRERLVWTGLMVALIFGAFAALAVVLFSESRAGSDAGAGVAEFSALVAGLFGLLKLLGTLTDSSKRMAAWHKARSRLKEILYGLETDWRGRAWDEEGARSPEFEKALVDATRAARAVLDEEQQAYFESVASPTSLLDVVTGSTNRMRDEVVRAVSTREDDERVRAAARRDAEDELERARARERAARRWLETLEAAEERDDGAIADARSRIRDAERDRILAEEELAAMKI